MHLFKTNLKLALATFILCGLWLGAPNGANANSKNHMIEPFMAVPFGSTREEVMQVEGYYEDEPSFFFPIFANLPKTESSFLPYTKTFMDIPVRVTYVFETKMLINYRFIKPEADDAKYNSVKEVSVSFTKTGSTLEDARQICSAITARIKAQMHNPQGISKQYERAPVELDAENDKVFVIKEYLKDENIISALNIWWYPNEGVLVADLNFYDAKSDYRDAQSLGYLFEPPYSSENLLNANADFPFQYAWGMTPGEFKAKNGAPKQAFRNWYYGTRLVYDKTFLGIPMEIFVHFTHNNKYIGTETLSSFGVHIVVPCASLQEAEAISLKVNENLAVVSSSYKGAGVGTPRGYQQDRRPSWMGISLLVAPNASVTGFFSWHESRECLSMGIGFNKETLPNDTYAQHLAWARMPHIRIFYDVNDD